MAVDVVQGGDGKGAVASHGAGAVVGEGVHACKVDVAFGCAGGFPAAGVDDAGAQEGARGVDACPEVLGARDADDGIAGICHGLVEGVEADVPLGGVVRHDVGGAPPPAGIVFADDVEVVVDGESVGGVVVEQEPFSAAVGLDPPEGHVVADAQVPRDEDGAMGDGFKVCLVFSASAQGVDLQGVDVARFDGVEGFFRRGGVLLFHAGSQYLFHGDVPDALLFGDGGVKPGFEPGEVAALFVRFL